MKQLGVLIILLSLIFACKDEDTVLDDEDLKDENDLVITAIDFYPWEMYHYLDKLDTPDLTLRLFTTDIFPYSYGIATTLFIENNELTIRVDSINDDCCSGTLEPAQAVIPLADHIEKLTISYHGRKDEYAIAISEELVEILPVSVSFTNLIHARTFRYPENTFAYVCGTNVDNNHIYSDFLTVLRDSTEVTEYFFDGAGRIPYPESSSGYWVDFPTKFFTYENEAEYDRAGELLRQFTLDSIPPNSGANIYLHSWHNKKYMSWMMYE